jgi:hypothetical protein
MRFRKWAAVRCASVLVLVVLVFGLGRVSAQAALPDGVFVRDSGGTIYLIIGGQRARVPFYPATDGVINSVPDSGQYVVPGTAGTLLMLGPQPDFVNQPPVAVGQATATPTPTGDPPPTVTIQVDDDNAKVGQTVSITVIANDNHGIDWIEWEGTVVNDNGNDNKPTNDPQLDGSHRHDCDGNKQCAFVWQVTPTKTGDFTLRARARDDAENRSEWVSIEFRVKQ